MSSIFEYHTICAIVGFLVSAYAVIGNDSVQTLGTFLASNIKIFRWYWLWLASALIMVITLVYSWYINNGDISYGRLSQIPEVPIEWYHAAAPIVLLFLTKYGIPVSTTFLVLSTFASDILLKEMLVKSVVGYGLAAISSYLIWMILSRFINEKFNKVKKEHRIHWRVLQWISTGFLWFTWLAHDMANIGVFLPRKVPLDTLILSLVILCGWLAYIFQSNGGKIQRIILEKTGSRFMRSATIIDFVYAGLLFYFKEVNDIPMSTTWVFVGVLCGRELAIATSDPKYQLKEVFPLIGKDFFKIMIGLAVSVALVVLISSF